MKRTMILIPDDVDAELRFEAARRGVPIAQVAREALEAHFAGKLKRGPLSFFAVAEGEPTDVARQADEFVHRAMDERGFRS
jgi:hypothetical protein